MMSPIEQRRMALFLGGVLMTLMWFVASHPIVR